MANPLFEKLQLKFFGIIPRENESITVMNRYTLSGSTLTSFLPAGVPVHILSVLACRPLLSACNRYFYTFFLIAQAAQRRATG
jgi:hypothetical protein